MLFRERVHRLTVYTLFEDTSSVISQTVELTELGKEMYGFGEATAETTTKVTAATSAIAVQLALQEELAGITSERVRLDLLSTVARNEQADAQKAYGDAVTAVIDLEKEGKEGTEEYTKAIDNRERAGKVLHAANAKLESSEKAVIDLLDAEAQAAKDLAATITDITNRRADEQREAGLLAEAGGDVEKARVAERLAIDDQREAQKEYAAALKPESTEGGRRVSVLKQQEGAPVLLG